MIQRHEVDSIRTGAGGPDLFEGDGLDRPHRSDGHEDRGQHLAVPRDELSAAGRGVRVTLTGTTRPIRRELFAQGVRPPLVGYEGTIEAAVSKFKPARQ